MTWFLPARLPGYLQVWGGGQPQAERAEGEDAIVCQMRLGVMTHPGLPQDPPAPTGCSISNDV